jgi:hypothetical protein
VQFEKDTIEHDGDNEVRRKSLAVNITGSTPKRQSERGKRSPSRKKSSKKNFKFGKFNQQPVPLEDYLMKIERERNGGLSEE